MNYLGQSKQDEFVIKLLNYKTGGFFLEIGSNHPVNINNSYILEKKYNWTGLMVEFDSMFEPLYKKHRNSYYIIQDATTINYNDLFVKYNFPYEMDYLQIDLEVSNGSTLNTLKLLDETLMKNYNFKVVTFEHDIYSGNYYDTREKSREIFLKNGYTRVFSDVKNKNCPYEDWYVSNLFPNMDLINKIKTDDSLDYSEIIQIVNNNIVV